MKRLSQWGSSNFCPELRKNALLISQSHFSNFALHVISSYIENTYTTLWRHTNLCCLCQMQNTKGLCCLCPNSKYKWLLQGKGSQIQINNKTIIEFGSRTKWGIIKASVCVICRSLRLRQITQTSALIIPHILLDLIHISFTTTLN